MSLSANFLMINNDIMKNLVSLDSNELSSKIEELVDSDDYDFYTINTIWNGLCFFLSGKSYDMPPDNSIIGRAIFGKEYFDGFENRDDFYIAYNGIDTIQEIVRALEDVNLKQLIAEFDTKKFMEAKVCPGIWETEEEDILVELLTSEHRGLLSFYREALKKKMNVVISIY